MAGELTQAQAIWFVEEVRKIRTELLKQDVPELEAFTMFDVETDVPVGAQEFGSDMITQFGESVVISNNSDDLQFAEVGVYRSVHKVIAFGIGYKWTHMEALTAAQSRKVPRRLRGLSARDIQFQELNDIIVNGKAAYGVHGFLTYPGLPRHQMATTFSSADAAEDIVDDMLDLLVRPIKATLNVRKPSHFAIPLEKYLYVATRRAHSTAPSDTTILEFFRIQARGILGQDLNIMASWMFDVATKCAVWKRGEKANAKAVIPGNLRFAQLEPQRINFEYRVPTFSVSGGWYTEYPLATCIGEFSA